MKPRPLARFARLHFAGVPREWLWVAFLLVVLLPAQAWFAITWTTQGVAHRHVHGSVHRHDHDGVQRHVHAVGVPMVAVDASEVRLHASFSSSERQRHVSLAVIALAGAGLPRCIPLQSVRSAFVVPDQPRGWLFAYRLDRPPRSYRVIRDTA
jgi:hypothetical protein